MPSPPIRRKQANKKKVFLESVECAYEADGEESNRESNRIPSSLEIHGNIHVVRSQSKPTPSKTGGGRRASVTVEDTNRIPSSLHEILQHQKEVAAHLNEIRHGPVFIG